MHFTKQTVSGIHRRQQVINLTYEELKTLLGLLKQGLLGAYRQGVRTREEEILTGEFLCADDCGYTFGVPEGSSEIHIREYRYAWPPDSLFGPEQQKPIRWIDPKRERPELMLLLAAHAALPELLGCTTSRYPTILDFLEPYLENAPHRTLTLTPNEFCFVRNTRTGTVTVHAGKPAPTLCSEINLGTDEEFVTLS